MHAWVAADAGRPPPDGVQRGGVRAALAAGDRALAGHLLGCLALTVAERGDGPAALRVAGAAERVAAGSDPATATVLALRVAFAAALTGDRRTCDTALATAEHAHARGPAGLDPPWLYWLDDAHVDALAGLCLATSGRPAAALPFLAAALRAPTVRFRAAGLVCAAAAHAHLTAGDLDAACAAAAETLLACVDSGSFRVLHRLRRLEQALHAAAGGGLPPAALRGYKDLAESAATYLPGAAPVSARPAPIIRRRVPAGSAPGKGGQLTRARPGPTLGPTGHQEGWPAGGDLGRPQPADRGKPSGEGTNHEVDRPRGRHVRREHRPRERRPARKAGCEGDGHEVGAVVRPSGRMSSVPIRSGTPRRT